MYIDKEKILKFLPHRDPFLFIDSVESIKKDGLELNMGDIKTNPDTIGVTVEGNFLVRNDLEILRGHFPGNPILPGVVQVEMMAQASSFVITVRDEKPFDIDLKVLFMGVNNVKFRKPVTPEMQLKIFAECIKCRGGFKNPIMSHRCKIMHENMLVSQADILATVSY